MRALTGEHKAALIISFTVVLLVGVLISDHLSEAQQPGSEAVGDGLHPVLVVQAPAKRAPELVVPELEPVQSRAFEAVSDRDEGSLGHALAGVDPEGIDDAPIGPTIITLGGGTEGSDTGRSFLDGLRDRVLGGLDPMPVPPPTTGSRETARDATPVRYHHVQHNEPLYKIAAQYYGDGNLWRRLAEANPDRVGKDGSVREGVALRIPTSEELGIAHVNARQGSEARGETTPRKEAASKRKVVVARGETLGEIAQRELGSVKRMGDILSANPKIRDPNDIRAGMELVLPEAD